MDSMMLTLGVTDHRLLADTYTQTTSAMTTRERVAEGIVGVGYFAAAAALLAIAPPGGLRAGPVVLSLLLMILATRVRFDTPLGFTVATQLAFVPMLFAVPVTVVPLITVAAFALADVPDLLRGRIHPSRVLLAIGNSWFTIGPVAVFAISGVAPKDAGLGLLLAALGAQFAVDFLVSGVRLAIARDADLRSLVGDCWIYAVDAALSGVALAVAQDMR
jgi:hypothetical protein